MRNASRTARNGFTLPSDCFFFFAGRFELAGCKTLETSTFETSSSCLSILQFATGPKRSIGHLLGAEGCSSRPTVRHGHTAAAPVESCQSLPGRCPWGRLGSVLYTCKRLHRIRRRFKHGRILSTSRPTGPGIAWQWLPGLSESTRLPHRWRVRYRRLPTTRPTPRGLQEPICIHKK